MQTEPKHHEVDLSESSIYGNGSDEDATSVGTSDDVC